MMEQQAEAQEPLFRPSKRRKLIRRKQEEDVSDDSTPLQTPPLAPLDKADNAEEDERPNDGLPRQRKLMGTKRGGIGFSTSAAQRNSSNTPQDGSDKQALVPVANPIGLASSRFMAPTGQVTSSDDKHMMAYIDSKLASIRSSNPQPTASSTSKRETYFSDQNNTRLRSQIDGDPITGSTATSHNISPSETPTQHTAPATVTASSSTKPTKHSIQPIAKPPRLGRDGKPLRPRRDRQRRTSFDIARDAMVEQVLRESRLDNIYDTQPPSTSAAAQASTGQDEEADERMAAEFRREFIAAMEERSVRRPPPPPAGGKNDPVKGPKLGGSRQQRAAMRAMEEKAGKAGKK